MKILVFGNPFIHGDSLPLRILPDLRKEFPEIEFREFDTAEDLEKETGDLVVLDTVKRIRKVKIFTEIDSFSDSPRYSLHDFDLLFSLKLLKKMKLVKKVTIIGVPSNKVRKKTIEDVSNAIKKLILSNQ
jgi:Ni,Fe-hydrogenase maturation factor